MRRLAISIGCAAQMSSTREKNSSAKASCRLAERGALKPATSASTSALEYAPGVRALSNAERLVSGVGKAWLAPRNSVAPVSVLSRCFSSSSSAGVTALRAARARKIDQRISGSKRRPAMSPESRALRRAVPDSSGVAASARMAARASTSWASEAGSASSRWPQIASA